LRDLPVGPITDDAILGDYACPGIGRQLFVLAKTERDKNAGLVETAHRPLLRAHLRPVFVKRVRMRTGVQYAVVIAHGVLGKRHALLPLVDFQLISFGDVVGTRLIVRFARTRFRELRNVQKTQT